MVSYLVFILYIFFYLVNPNSKSKGDDFLSYQILMDSCGDLSEGMRNNEHLRMIPLQIRVGQKEW